MMLKDRDFIFTGLQPWDISIGSNAKDIALEISKNNRVLYVNAPRKGINEYNLKQIGENIWILDVPVKMLPINFLPDGFIFDVFNKFNQKKISKYILKAINKLGFKDYIHFIDNDIYNSFFMNELLAASYTIYYRRDNMVNSYWQRHAPRLEPLLAKKSDIVVANSLVLAEAMQNYNNNVHDIGQGVDLSAYSLDINYDVPEDIIAIPRPIVGYTGALMTLRLDIELLYKLAIRRTDISFVFVGGEDENFKCHKIHNLPNVYFLGNKAPNLMPNYISAFDICFNPQIINPTTIGNYPRKIDEYLALGKPVIATKTKTMSIFENYVWNCETIEDYLKSIDSALAISNDEMKEKRIKFAKTHSWENSVNRIYEVITYYVKSI